MCDARDDGSSKRRFYDLVVLIKTFFSSAIDFAKRVTELLFRLTLYGIRDFGKPHFFSGFLAIKSGAKPMDFLMIDSDFLREKNLA